MHVGRDVYEKPNGIPWWILSVRPFRELLLARQREHVAQRIRAIGCVDDCVDLTRGVRCNGQRIVNAVQEQIARMRVIAEHETLSQPCLDRLEQAERVVPKMQATIAFVSGYVRQQIVQLDLTQSVSCAMHTRRPPS